MYSNTIVITKTLKSKLSINIHILFNQLINESINQLKITKCITIDQSIKKLERKLYICKSKYIKKFRKINIMDTQLRERLF